MGVVVRFVVLLREHPISTYARVTQRTQTDARRKITAPVRTYLMDRPLKLDGKSGYRASLLHVKHVAC